MYIKKLSLFLLFAWVINSHAAGAETFAQFAESMSYTGAQFSSRNTQGITNVDIHIDEQKLLNAVPALVQAGLLNPQINQTIINLMPVTLSYVVAQSVSLATVIFMYQNSRIDKLHITSYLQVPDDYGHLENHLIHSFSFNRKLYERIDWRNFQIDKLPKVAPGFKYSRWFMQKVTDEQQ